MMQKGEKSPRPKFHVFFPFKETTSAEQYTAMKHKVAQIFLYFDKNALDAGRFFFGTQKPKVEILAGNSNLTAFLAEYDASHHQAVSQATIPESSEPVAANNIKVPNEHHDVIPQGARNLTLLSYAEKVLKHYGATDTAYRDFLNEAKKCVPLLDEDELSDIWQNTVRYYQMDIATNSGYIQPEDFNAPPASDIQMVLGSYVSTGLTGKKVIHMHTDLLKN